MSDVKMQTIVRRFDSAHDAQFLRACVIDQQDFHRRFEPSWPEGEAIIDDYLTYLETECDRHNGCIIIAQHGEQPAGFVCVVAAVCGEAPDDPAPFALIHDIYVKAEHRQRGVASLLMAEAERFARGEGATSLRLGVLDGNERARTFYAQRGFREYTHVLTKALE